MHLRDIYLRNDSDSSVLGILHNLPSIFLSVEPATLEMRCELRESIYMKNNVSDSVYTPTYALSIHCSHGRKYTRGKLLHFAFNTKDAEIRDVPVKHIHLYVAHGIQEVQY